uniref:Tr-type G domain-containing protein n=1 Tax=Plectus sambesii TaxID=2011161 RepID=A0A914XGQ5_9BILA
MAGVIPPLLLQRLQESSSCIRNVCILAHVDHGKTSIADSLVAANGIISSRMVGKLRYMDSRPDEQQRGITMKSSAIALYYKCDEKDFLINLIDSPGHVDFCGEVSTATRVCDSAVIVVDVVEGVCPQTHTVLRQACREGLRTVLVLNKIDRLILELKMTALEAYRQINVVIEQVNSIAGEIFLSEMIDQEVTDDQADWNDEAALDAREERVHFEPSKGNVVFCSAIDGWGFTVGDFARILSKKTGMNESVLANTLWGDFYFDAKAKRIRKGAVDNGKKPIFVQLVLDNIWAVYTAVLVDKDVEKTLKMCESLQISLSARDQRHADARIRLTAIFHQWLPLAAAVLSAVCRKTPPPTEAIDDARLQALVGASAASMNAQVKEALMRCDTAGPTVVFISKMVAVEKKSLPSNRKGPMTMEEIRRRRQEALDKQKATVDFDESQNSVKDYSPTDAVVAVTETSDHVFLGFARVFSGTIRVGETLNVLPVNYTGNVQNVPLVQVTVGQLYMFMGRELEQVDRVPAGNLVGISGLEDVVLKSATLSSSTDCPSLAPLQTYAEPIVRVSIEPKIPGQLDALCKGLKLLNQADPCVRAIIQDTGEMVLVTAGEMHLERCLTDLRERYSRDVTELIVSEPIIPFLETIVNPPKIDRVNEAIEVTKGDRQRDQKDAHIMVSTANKKCHFRIRALPLPACVFEVLERHNAVLDALGDRQTKLSMKTDDPAQLSFGDMLNDIIALRKELIAAFEQAWEEHHGDASTFWSTRNKDDAVHLVDQ